MIRKEFFWYLRDHASDLRIGDLQNLGLLPPAQNQGRESRGLYIM